MLCWLSVGKPAVPSARGPGVGRGATGREGGCDGRDGILPRAGGDHGRPQALHPLGARRAGGGDRQAEALPQALRPGEAPRGGEGGRGPARGAPRPARVGLGRARRARDRLRGPAHLPGRPAGRGRGARRRARRRDGLPQGLREPARTVVLPLLRARRPRPRPRHLGRQGRGRGPARRRARRRVRGARVPRLRARPLRRGHGDGPRRRPRVQGGGGGERLRLPVQRAVRPGCRVPDLQRAREPRRLRDRLRPAGAHAPHARVADAPARR